MADVMSENWQANKTLYNTAVDRVCVAHLHKHHRLISASLFPKQQQQLLPLGTGQKNCGQV